MGPYLSEIKHSADCSYFFLFDQANSTFLLRLDFYGTIELYKITHFKEVNMISSKVILS